MPWQQNRVLTASEGVLLSWTNSFSNLTLLDNDVLQHQVESLFHHLEDSFLQHEHLNDQKHHLLL